MGQLKQLILIEVRSFLKVSITFFFSFIFPLLLMFIIMMSTGNPLIDETYHLINKYVILSYVIGLVPLTLISFPISVAADIEYGIIERYKLFNISMMKVFLAKFLVNFVAMLLQIVVITCVAFIFNFKIPPIDALLVFMVFYIIISLNLFTLGWILACVLKKVNKVQTVGMAIMFIFLAMCGAFGEFENLPKFFDYIKYVIPTCDVTTSLTNVWLGYEQSLLPLFIKYIIYDGVLLALAVIVSNFKFKSLKKIKIVN